MTNIYTLARDEYLFLHAAFRSPFAWSIQVEFESEAAEQAALDAAAASLQEKGYISWQGDQMYVVPALWQLIKGCTAPQQVLISTYVTRQNIQDTRFVYWSDNGNLIEDRVLPSQSRRLRALKGINELIARVKTQIHINGQTQPAGKAQVISSAVLESVRQAVTQGKEAVVSELAQADIDEPSVNALAKAYTEPIANTMLTRIIVDQEGASTNLVLIESQDGLWGLYDLDDAQIQLVPLNVDMLDQVLGGFCGLETESE